MDCHGNLTLALSKGEGDKTDFICARLEPIGAGKMRFFLKKMSFR
jgi:hypothetical protein